MVKQMVTIGTRSTPTFLLRAIPITRPGTPKAKANANVGNGHRVNGENLAATDVALSDKALDIDICPVGCIIQKRRGFFAPIGQRQFDPEPIGSEVENHQQETAGEEG